MYSFLFSLIAYFIQSICVMLWDKSWAGGKTVKRRRSINQWVKGAAVTIYFVHKLKFVKDAQGMMLQQLATLQWLLGREGEGKQGVHMSEGKELHSTLLDTSEAWL